MHPPASRKSPAKSGTKKTPSPKAAATGSTKAAAKTAADDTLPDEADIQAALAPVRAFISGTGEARVRDFLSRLALHPPQVLLLEGADAQGRLAAAHYWALLLNCAHNARNENHPDTLTENRQEAFAAPCLSCPECVRMVTHMHRDCFFLDGLSGSIKIDDVRALREVLGEPPREATCRIVIFREAQALGEAAANSLLKSFEEPRPGTSFVLLAPQRERLLPTLVSRSFTITLPWPLEEDRDAREKLASWEAALCTFLRSGRDFFEKSGTKGAVDVPLAHALIGLCRRALARALTWRCETGVPFGQKAPAELTRRMPFEGLEVIFAHLPEPRLRMLDEALAECQDSLLYTVNPTLVVEWLATRIYLLAR